MTLVIRPENIDRLDRFLYAQEAVWPTVIEELTSGTKRSHWMWFVFPQLRSLGRSATAHYFGLSDLAEADRSLENNVLGSPDNLKLRSSMTLFSKCTSFETLPQSVLDKFFDGDQDERTLQCLGVDLGK